MDVGEIGRHQWKALIASIVLILAWISIPLYMQVEHGYSAIKVSFAITVFYYIGFKLWKRNDLR